MEKIRELNILIAGVGGQGTILASEIICRVAFTHEQNATIGETYGASQRGGSVLSHVRIGKDVHGPLIPFGRADIVLGFEPLECARVALLYLVEGGWIISNSSPIFPVDVISRKAKYPSLETLKSLIGNVTNNFFFFDAVALACKAGDILSLNMVMVGVFASSHKNPFPKGDFEREIETVPQAALNLHAFKLGCDVDI
jgi:indolepyruvate ferredoxin oxidoreductase beta subunit